MKMGQTSKENPMKKRSKISSRILKSRNQWTNMKLKKPRRR
jgi:hypothetical protein